MSKTDEPEVTAPSTKAGTAMSTSTAANDPANAPAVRFTHDRGLGIVDALCHWAEFAGLRPALRNQSVRLGAVVAARRHGERNPSASDDECARAGLDAVWSRPPLRESVRSWTRRNASAIAVARARRRPIRVRVAPNRGGTRQGRARAAQARPSVASGDSGDDDGESEAAPSSAQRRRRRHGRPRGRKS